MSLAMAGRGVRLPLGHVELWTDHSTAADPPRARIAGDHAVIWEDQHVHILALERS